MFLESIVLAAAALTASTNHSVSVDAPASDLLPARPIVELTTAPLIAEDEPPIEDLEPIYYFKSNSPDLLVLANWTSGTLYFRVFYDCDGDGEIDGWDEVFVDPGDPGSDQATTEVIVPDDGCTILEWGLYDILPWGDCFPIWQQSPQFPSLVHFY